jgi:hypothetical protein
MQPIKSKSVVRLSKDTPTVRHWNGRDDNAAHYHQNIPIDQKEITLTLKWKASAHGKKTPVGFYKINLPGLTNEGYVEKRTAGYFLRFQRTGTKIEIAINRGSKALEVGSWP